MHADVDEGRNQTLQRRNEHRRNHLILYAFKHFIVYFLDISSELASSNTSTFGHACEMPSDLDFCLASAQQGHSAGALDSSLPSLAITLVSDCHNPPHKCPQPPTTEPQQAHVIHQAKLASWLAVDDSCQFDGMHCVGIGW